MSLRFGQRMTEQEAMLLNPLQLAYLGDSVWEMIVRCRLLFQSLNVRHLHESAVRRVNAAAQAAFAGIIFSELTEKEREIVRRGRNAHARHPVPKNQNPDDYAQATGFEALWGYLYITGQDERITQLARIIQEQESDENG